MYVIAMSPLRSARFVLFGLILTWAYPEGGGGGGDRGSGPPLKNYNNIGFLSNTGPDPLKNHKATKPAFNFGPLLARQRYVRHLNGSAHD